jgi:hypothetical protein
MPDFEIYDRRSSSTLKGGRRGATVTVTRRGYMSFSPEAFARLGSPQAVLYLIAKDERLIGFRPCKPRDENAHSVSGRIHSMSASALLKHMGIAHDEARRYDLQAEDGQPPHIDLKQPGKAVSSNRLKR